jgi:hypothetical protein
MTDWGILESGLNSSREKNEILLRLLNGQENEREQDEDFEDKAFVRSDT